MTRQGHDRPSVLSAQGAIRSTVFVFAVLVVGFPGLPAFGQAGADVRLLQQGQTDKRDIGPGECRSHRVAIKAGQFLEIIVTQNKIDWTVTVYLPDGRKATEFDNPPISGDERVLIAAESDGDHRVEVCSPSSGESGGYEIKINEVRPSVPQDKARIAAYLSSCEAVKHRLRRTPESYRKAVEKQLETLAHARESGDRGDVAQAVFYTGYTYSLMGDRPKALEYYRQSLPLYREIEDWRGVANALNNIGSIRRDFGEFAEALAVYREALDLFRKTANRTGEAVTLNNIGLILDNIGEKQPALEHYRQSLDLRRASGDRRGEGNVLGNIGLVHATMGKFREALDFYNQASPIFRETNNRVGLAANLNNIGILYDALGLPEKSVEHYTQALDVFRKEGDKHGEAYSLANLGWVHDQLLGRKREALEYYEQALRLRRAVGDRFGEAHTLIDLGRIYVSTGEADKGFEFLNSGLALMRVVGTRRGEGYALNSLGGAYELANDSANALDAYERSLALRRAVGDRIGQAGTLAALARVEFEQGKIESARLRVEEAVEHIEGVRADTGDREHQASFFSTVRSTYELYVEILMRLHQADPKAGHDAAAFRTCERGRARNLLDMLAEAHADVRRGIAPERLAEERALRLKLNAVVARQTRLSGAPPTSDGQLSAVNKEVADLTAQYQDLLTRIRHENPRYASLTQPRPTTLADLQDHVLDSETALVEYSLGDRRSYVWIVTKTSFSAVELARRAEIEAAARRFVSLQAARSERVPFETADKRHMRIKRADEELADAGRTLGQLILDPIALRLDRKRLVFVPDGALHYVPFAALPTPRPADGGQKNRQGDSETQNPSSSRSQLLIERSEIVALPSASVAAVLREERKDRPRPPKTLMVIADPVFEKTDPRLTAAVRSASPSSSAHAEGDTLGDLAENRFIESVRALGEADERFSIRRLPGTRREAEQILALVPPKQAASAFDFKADYATATAGDLNRYRIVHFATHGFVNTMKPELSGLVLSLVNEKGEDQNGFLLTPDVFNLDLSADLVVLSACKTGFGKEIRGEGIVGLTHGFLYAGASRVVVSLWDVEDTATKEFMKRFYRGLLVENLTPGDALRSAQLFVRKQPRWSHPFYWAGFTLQGDWKRFNL